MQKYTFGTIFAESNIQLVFLTRSHLVRQNVHHIMKIIFVLASVFAFLKFSQSYDKVRFSSWFLHAKTYIGNQNSSTYPETKYFRQGLCIYFKILNSSRSWQNFVLYFVHFWGIGVSRKNAFKIYWPLLDLRETERNASNSVNHVQISFTESQRTKLHTRKIDRGKVNEIFSEPWSVTESGLWRLWTLSS